MQATAVTALYEVLDALFQAQTEVLAGTRPATSLGNLLQVLKELNHFLLSSGRLLNAIRTDAFKYRF